MIRRTKIKKKYVRGYGTRKGSGIFDTVLSFVNRNKDVIKNIGDVASSAMKVGINTKNLVQELRKPKAVEKDSELEDIINRINNVRTGRGFHYA